MKNSRKSKKQRRVAKTPQTNMKKLTPQQNLVYEYIKEFGKISPAHKGGLMYRGKMFGSETTKRCRELEELGLVVGFRNGRFVDYKLKGGVETGEKLVQLPKGEVGIMTKVNVKSEQPQLFKLEPQKLRHYEQG